MKQKYPKQEDEEKIRGDGKEAEGERTGERVGEKIHNGKEENLDEKKRDEDRMTS